MNGILCHIEWRIKLIWVVIRGGYSVDNILKKLNNKNYNDCWKIQIKKMYGAEIIP